MSGPNHSKSPKTDSSLNRRDFVKHLGATALGGTLSFTLLDNLLAGQCGAPTGAQLAAADPNAPAVEPAQPKYQEKNRVEGMPYIPWGRTNLMVSRLSLGGTPWQPMVVKRALSLGVNMVHGSNGYGTMEEQAKTLEKLWDKCWFTLKQGPGEDNMAECLDKCLKTLNRDHVDIIVPVITDQRLAQADTLKSDFEKLKKAGKVSLLGATVHTKSEEIPTFCRKAIDADIFDMILTMYQPENKTAIDKELTRALEKNIGTMSMKTLQGTDKEGRAKVITAALADGTIQTVLKGINSMAELDEYYAAVKLAQKPQPEGEPQACLDPTACGACGQCGLCPNHIEIQEIMRCVTYYQRQTGLEHYAAQTYRDLPALTTVLGCGDCGRCELQCPRHLPIRDTLRWAHNHWA